MTRNPCPSVLGVLHSCFTIQKSFFITLHRYLSSTYARTLESVGEPHWFGLHLRSHPPLPPRLHHHFSTLDANSRVVSRRSPCLLLLHFADGLGVGGDTSTSGATSYVLSPLILSQ